MNRIFESIFERMNEEQPLVHNITNYVTVNDCANALLAVKASPIMADDAKEVEDITALSSALVLNIGTLNERTVESMLISGKKANDCGIPVVFDPVGAGASSFRNEVARKLLDSIQFTVIRGNLSEVGFLSGLAVTTKGVDVSEKDKHLKAEDVAKMVSKQQNCTVVITGKTDVISNGESTYRVHNGHEMMASITGTGCVSSAVMGAFLAVSDEPVTGALLSTMVMGCAGELAFEEVGNLGTGSFKVSMMDRLSRMSPVVIEERGRYEEID